MTVLYYGALVFNTTAPETDPIYTIGFDYISRGNIYVFANGTRLNLGPGITGRFEFVDDGRIKINGVVAANTKIVIRRFTRKDQRLAEYFNGATLTEFDLNIVSKQLLFIIQELFDWITGINAGDPLPGGPGSGIGDDDGSQDPPTLIDDLIQQILDTQLFRDLVALIPLFDINGELLVSTLLNDHNSWSEERRLTEFAVGLENGIADAVVQINDVDIRATTAIQVQQSRIDGALSRIGTIETTYATRDFALTEITTQLDARFAPAAFNGVLNASSVIQGINLRADVDGTRINGLTSYLAGSGITYDANGNIVVNPANLGGLAQSLSVVQQTVNVQATQLLTEAAFRTALASRFTAGGQPTDVSSIVAGIEDAWKTYADEDSAVARRVTSLEANTKPIFFRATIPSPYSVEFAGTPFATQGFPQGSLWFRQVGNQRRPYYWHRGSTAPGPITGLDPENDFFLITGTPTSAQGYWWLNTDDNLANAVGGRIDNVEQVLLEGTSARVVAQKTLAVAFGYEDSAAGYAAVSERMEAFVDPTDGLLYSTWNVRVNAQLGANSPVIAGFGLGLQGNIDNPNSFVSDFIVMANRFSVINPPTGDVLSGPLNPSTVTVPFIIDSATSRVIVNGQLLARSLSATDAAVGRLTAGQINPLTGELADPSGIRLVIPSSTNGWWTGGTVPSGLNGAGQPQNFLIWAGSGALSDNNSIFYVDTFGNAVFRGRVAADNISGNVGEVFGFSGSGGTPPAAPNNQYGPEVIVASTTVPDVPGATPRKLAVMVSAVIVEGGGTSSGKLRVGVTPVGSSEITVAESNTLASPRGATTTLVGATGPLPQGATIRVYYANFDNGSGTCSGVSGIIQSIR